MAVPSQAATLMSTAFTDDQQQAIMMIITNLVTEGIEVNPGTTLYQRGIRSIESVTSQINVLNSQLVQSSTSLQNQVAAANAEIAGIPQLKQDVINSLEAIKEEATKLFAKIDEDMKDKSQKFEVVETEVQKSRNEFLQTQAQAAQTQAQAVASMENANRIPKEAEQLRLPERANIEANFQQADAITKGQIEEVKKFVDILKSEATSGFGEIIARVAAMEEHTRARDAAQASSGQAGAFQGQGFPFQGTSSMGPRDTGAKGTEEGKGKMSGLCHHRDLEIWK